MTEAVVIRCAGCGCTVDDATDPREGDFVGCHCVEQCPVCMSEYSYLRHGDVDTWHCDNCGHDWPYVATVSIAAYRLGARS